MKLTNANIVSKFKVIVAGRQRGQKEHELKSAHAAWVRSLPCSLSYHLYAFKLCTCNHRQLSWSTSHIPEQATLTESSFFFLCPWLRLYCLINEQKLCISPFIEVLTQALQPEWWSKERQMCRWVVCAFVRNCLALPVLLRLSSHCPCLTRFLHTFTSSTSAFLT